MGHKLTAMGLIAAGVTYCGLAIVFAADLPEGGADTVRGTLLVLGAALAFAWHHLLAKRALPALGSALFTSGQFAASPRFLWLSAGCAVFATVLPTLCINAGLARTSPQIVAMISTVSPIVTIGLAVVILGETFTLADAAGAALVLAGVGLYTFGERKSRDTGAAQSPTDLPGDEQDVVEAERT
jgi:drug/metabolite transporter (DMT)-like permease